ncbi:MAG: hypothetical protein AAF657_00010 [Acidobacteriota bacterium]
MYRSTARSGSILRFFVFAVLAFPCQMAGQSWINWETPHVHPLTMTPDGERLLAVNTADGRLEIFDLSTPSARLAASIPVGMDPVSVRARSNDEAWVVNHISDTISIVDLETRNVRTTVQTLDEPADVVFAGNPQRAFVSCAQANTVMVFDPESLEAVPILIPLQAEDPRALAVSADGQKVLVAIFQSGNGTTALRGRLVIDGNDVTPLNHPAGPYGGRNPPPNAGSTFEPPIDPEYLPEGQNPAPQVSLIVRRQAEQWLDDNGSDWTEFVSGSLAPIGLRPEGWNLLDHDIAVIDTSTLAVDWIDGLMNAAMAIAVNPVSGAVTLAGTEATNEVRFEPNLKARFLRVRLASTDLLTGSSEIADLNGDHLDYSDAQVEAQADPASASQVLRDRSLGDPRAILWNSTGTTGYIAGMGSNNVVVIDPAGQRRPGAQGATARIEVGEGPTGLALDEPRGRLYVLNKFSASLSVIDLATRKEIERLPFHDPTRPEVRQGRRFLYDTHLTSGLGHVSCASCHIDARMDRLAWDLGDPGGEIKPINGEPGQHNLAMNVPGLNTDFLDFHPMKGPMVTQTLQDIVGKEPHHWRGDRDGLEEFNGAFTGLQGDDRQLTAAEMQQFEDFLASIHLPPNPYRQRDNALPTDLPLPGQFSDGRYADQGGLPVGAPMPNGNPRRGLELFRPPNSTALFGLACSSCHTLPTGAGSDHTLNLQTSQFEPIPPGADGENHLALFIMDGTVESTIKVPQLRNLHEKTGFDTTLAESHQGFGYEHDGVTDTLTRFHMHPTFFLANDQEVSDIVAFMLAFAGSDLPPGSTAFSPFDFFEPPGPTSLDTHAAVGAQWTVTAANRNSPATLAEFAELRALADSGRVGLTVKGIVAGQQRGFAYLGADLLQSDRATETTTLEALRQSVAAGEEVTLTLVPAGSETRLGVDRDEDGIFDRDEIDACSDPADPSPSTLANCTLFADGFESGDTSAWQP